MMGTRLMRSHASANDPAWAAMIAAIRITLRLSR